MSRALLDRESKLDKALTRAHVRLNTLDHPKPAWHISHAQFLVYEADRRPSDAESLDYVRRAYDHVRAASDALKRLQRPDCEQLTRRCEALVLDALKELDA